MTNNTKSPEEIEREIERERAGLTDTLDDLKERFSVDAVARQVTEHFREHGGEIGRSLSDAAKRNPVALAVTGVGLAWLMFGDKSGEKRESHNYDRYDRVGAVARDDYGDDYGVTADRNGSRRSIKPTDSRSNPASGSLGPQPGDRSKPYYSGHYAQPDSTPLWVQPASDRDDGDDTDDGLRTKMNDAASGTREQASNAASLVAGSARSAGATIAQTAKDGASVVSDTGNGVIDGARNLALSVSDQAAALKARLAEGTEELSEEARNRVVAARESAIEARDAAMTYARQGRDRATDIFEDQPLIAGALAVALGAALGAALPRSRMEDEYLGAQSDQLMHEAERIFAEEKQKLGKVAKAATQEAKNVVRDVKDEAEKIATSLMDKAKESGERFADAVESEAKEQNVGGVTQS